MLPYRLRPPIYGKKLQRLKDDKAGEDVLRGGGPVQRAIEQDLLAIRGPFLKVTQEQQQASTTNSHWDSGKSFRCFKTVFGSSKVAALHSLVPKKCDKESFSQLIYAACLSLLKTSFQADNFELENSCHALFCLYALFKTNPLPRATTTPFQLVPVGLVSAENPKFLYRRAFAPNIRVDRYHYSLLLRLRAQAQARQAECQEHHMASHQQQARGAENDSTHWTCQCGIATDTLELVDRLLPDLDLGEYTGPVSLEGLAGHADYPYPPQLSKLPTISVPEHAEEALEIPPACAPFTYSNDMEELLQSYQSSLETIRLPDIKTPVGTRVRKALDPVYNSKESWSEVLARLFPSSNNTTPANIPAPAASMTSRRILPRAREEPGASARVTFGENSFLIPPPEQEDAEPASYELVLPSDLSTSIQDIIHKSLEFLVQRQGPLLPNTEETPMPPPPPRNTATDDVSSIGDGGISVITGRGRAALQTLLSTAQQNAGVPRVATIPTRAAPPAPSRPGDNFLSMDSFANDGDDDDESAASDVSNLSLQDEEEEEDEMMSVATSAVGRKALETLLSTVTQPKSKPNGKRKKRPSRKRDSTARKYVGNRPAVAVDGDDSFATSVGQGRAALDVLLSKINDDSSGYSEEDNSQAPSEEQLNEDQSLAGNSIGQGRAALYALLSQTNDEDSFEADKSDRNKSTSRMLPPSKRKASTRKAPPRKRAAPTRAVSKSKRAKYEAVAPAEDESVATSVGPGRAALDALLSRVEGTDDRSQPSASTRSASRSRRAKAKYVAAAPSGDESVATSVGPDRAALGALLSQAEGNDDHSQPSASTRSARRSRRAKYVAAAPSGDESVATSVGPGRAALDSLLSRVEGTDDRSQPSASTRSASRSRRAKYVAAAPSGDESVATASGPGRAALDSLLSQVEGNDDHNGSASVVDTKPSATAAPGEDESVATSVGPGRAALDSLLSRLDDDDSHHS